MSSSTWTFALWIVLMLWIVIAVARHARRSKKIDSVAEQIASSALPEIGAIAEKKYQARYGRPPTGRPGESWYPHPGQKRI